MPNPNLVAGPGKPKGMVNQTTRIRQMFADMGYDPIQEMAKMALDPKTPRSLRVALDKECAKYVAPQLRSVEVTGEQGGPMATRIHIVYDTVKEGEQNAIQEEEGR